MSIGFDVVFMGENGVFLSFLRFVESVLGIKTLFEGIFVPFYLLLWSLNQ